MLRAVVARLPHTYRHPHTYIVDTCFALFHVVIASMRSRGAVSLGHVQARFFIFMCHDTVCMHHAC